MSGYNLADIVFEDGPYWVLRTKRGYEVYCADATASSRVATIGYHGTDGLTRAKAEVARRLAHIALFDRGRA